MKARTRRAAVVLGTTGLLLFVAFVGLRSTKRKRGPSAVPAHVSVPAAGAAASDPDDDGGADADGGSAIVEDARRYEVRTWSFPLDRFELSIVDVAMAKAPLGALLARTQAELVVNGGFFDPNGKALGLAVSGGAVLSRPSKAMSGGMLTFDGDRARLWEAESFELPEGIRFGVQCKPRLVVDGALNIKRDDGHRSERTALCIRDGGRVIDVVVVRDESADIGGPSLFALGRHLVKRGCEAALNLDGGPSTGVAWRDEGRVTVLEPRGPLRHAIVVKRR
ncbi:MAG: phosphodiester glycosidase family protein [Deltaproteobacteria bacterium]|nr:phosphodiester glycosidase family protein [Deltaproteobacteria bacterium]